MVEFIEETHQYLIDGIIVPSVSELINFILPTTYDNVPEHYMEIAREYGTNVHQAIEDLEKYGFYSCNDQENHSVIEYLRLKFENDFEVIEQEMLVHYNTSYCGRFDGIFKIGDTLFLFDNKTTSTCHTEHLEWQLGFYKMAYENMTGETIDKCCCLWLPKNKKGKLIEIEPKPKEELLEVIESYEKK